MKKIICLSFILFVCLLTSCSQSVNYTILNEEAVNNMTAVSAYIDNLQLDKLDYKGYKVFDSSDDNKIVVISSGEANKTLKVSKVEKSSKDTGITIVQIDLPSEQKNSYVVIRLDEIDGAFFVFERIQYEGTEN